MHNHSKTKTKMGRRATVCLPLLSFFLATSAVAIDIDIVADAYEDVTDSSSSRQRSDHRRRQLGGARVNQQNDDAPDGKVNDAFYDLSLMTKDEKLNMIKMAYAVTHNGDNIDWDSQRDKFMDTVRKSRSSDSASVGNLRRLQTNTIDGNVFENYEYDKGNCPNAGSTGVPCAPDNLSSLCNKYDRQDGSFRSCLEACSRAFCCIHDAPQINFLAPNCNTDENCAQYNYCYIAWWKLHDTVGPALFLRIDQDDDFFDVDADEIESDSTGDALFTQVLLHHFDDINDVIADGTVNNEFNADRIFLDEDYWMYPVVGKVDVNDP